MKQLLLFLLVIVATSINAQNSITLEDLNSKNIFTQPDLTVITPDVSGDTYTSLDDNKIVRYSYASGNLVSVVFDLNTAFRELPFEAIEGYSINRDNTFLILETNRKKIYRRSSISDYYVYDLRKKEIQKLHDGGPQQEPAFSPDGYSIGYIFNDDLYIKNLRYNTSMQITNDGDSTHIINGMADWVYEEEFTITKMWEWSPDSKFIGFVKFDTQKVNVFSFPIYMGSNPSLIGNEQYSSQEVVAYPKAGTDNPEVSVYAYDIKNNVSRKMEVSGDPQAYYVPRIKWTTSDNKLCIFQLNRLQNQLDIYLANPRSTICKLLIKEKNERYLLEENLDEFEFLDGGEFFVMLSEQNGYNHLYLYKMDGTLVKQLTTGNFDVIDYIGYNTTSKLFYYQAAAKSPMQREVYGVDLKGKKTICFTPTDGYNSATFSSTFNYYAVNHTALNSPTTYRIYSSKGELLRTIEDNKELRNLLTSYQLPTKEFIKVPIGGGEVLNGWMMKPLNYSSAEKYPVVMFQYSGPNFQKVLDKFSIGWEHYLASNGYVVVCVDGRGTGARGEEFRKCTYQQLGILESDDQIATAIYLGKLPYVDAQRIAIWGWSFGGYNTLMALSRSNGVFKAGIAVAPVTDWKFYDTAYTERFMRTPNQNPNGYAATSPLLLAKDLSGALLLCHGTADDNVHFQNTVEYSEALIQAGKQFDLQIYPNRNHFIKGGNTRLHLYSRMMRFLERNL